MAKVHGKFVADEAGLARALTGPQGAAVLLAARAGRQIKAQAVTNAPVDTGKLQQNIYPDTPRVTGMRVELEVTAHQEYAAAVHQGVTGGKVIRPKHAKALRFHIGGREVFAKSVRQGAQKPRPFLLNAAKTVGARLGFTVSRVP